MPSETDLVLGWFDRHSFEPGALHFDDLLLRAVSEALAKPIMDTETYLERNRRDLWNAFLMKLEVDTRLGRSCLFEVRDRESRRIRWLPSIASQMPTRPARHRAAALAARPAVLQHIDTLTNRQYEALGCVVSKLVGAERAFLTPPGDDAGIDFLALVTVPGRCHVFGGTQRPLRVIGQCKKYKDRADIAEIREFITTITEIENQSSYLSQIVPPWFWTADGPIVGWFVAHSGLQSGGTTKARNHGIVVSDSLDLAEIIALSRSIDRSGKSIQRVDALHGMILKWLDTAS